MKRLAPFALALALALPLSPAARADGTVLLRANVLVDGELVRLGDLFENAGDKADIVVVRAPQPGRKLMLEPRWVAAVAAANGLPWHSMGERDHVVVERNSLTISHEQLAGPIVKALAGEGVAADADIELSNDDQLRVPVGSPPVVAVHDMYYDQVTGRFQATVEVPAGQPGAVRTRVAGRVFATHLMPVLVRDVPPGKVILAEDVEYRRMRDLLVRQDVLTDSTQVVGQAATRMLKAGVTLRPLDVQRPVVVTKNSVVTIVLRRAGMMLTTQGRAIEEGGKGEAIRVLNTQTNRTIIATVEGIGTVTVQPSLSVVTN